MREKSGISLISLSIAIIVLMIITGIIIYHVQDDLQIAKWKAMQNDIANLRDKISAHYAEKGNINEMLKTKYTNMTNIQQSGILNEEELSDTGSFYLINLSEIDNLTLNYGQDFEKLKTDEFSELTDTNIYIIHSTTHNIFYVQGITVGEETFYTDYTTADKDTEQIRLLWDT